MPTFEGVDLDQALDESGVAHETGADTDNSNLNALKSGFAHQPLQRGLVGWWPLAWDGAHDLSGEGNDGTLNGGVTTGVAGKGGLQAMSFDGTDDGVNLPSQSGDIKSISWWMNPDSAMDGSTREAYIGLATGHSYIVQTGGFNGLSSRALGMVGDPQDTETSVDSGISYPAGSWHHFVFRWNGSRYEIYHNAVEEPVDSGNSGHAPLMSDPDSLSIGYRKSNSDIYSDAQIADVRFYNRALSPAEIQTLYNWGSADVASPRTDGTSYYPLDGDATDAWGSNDGTTNGGVSWVDGIRGQAVSLDGADDYINTPFSYTFDNYSWSFWFKTGTSGLGEIIHAHDTTTVRSAVDIDGSGNISFWHKSGSTDDRVETNENAYNNEEWTHVVAVRTGSGASGLNIYVNGSNVTTTVLQNEGASSSSATDLFLGVYYDATNYFFPGEIDDVRIYPFALSPRQVHDLYQYGTFGIDMTQKVINQ